jgi:hypothetical protein
MGRGIKTWRAKQIKKNVEAVDGGGRGKLVEKEVTDRE